MQTTVEQLEDNRVKLHVAVPADGVRDRGQRRVPQARPRGAHPRVPARQGAPPDPRGALRHRRRPRAGAQGRHPRLLRRRGRRRGHRRDRAARDRHHRGRGGRRRRVRRGGRGAARRQPHRLRLADRSSSSSPRPTTKPSTRRSKGCASASAISRSRTEPLIDGNYAEMDISGSVDGEPVDALTATDFLYEVGSDGLAPALDEALRGKKPGDIVEFTDDAARAVRGAAPGKRSSFRVLVKDAKRKVLPELTDEWVSEVTEFETVDALRDDSRERIDDGRQAAGADGAPGPRARGARRPRARRGARAARPAGHGAAAPRPHAPARGRRGSTSPDTSPRPARTRRRSSTGSARDRPRRCSPISACGPSSPRRRSRRPTRSSTPRSTVWPSEWAKSPTGCGAISASKGCWRRYALTSPEARRWSS